MNIGIYNSPILNGKVELSKLLVGQRLTVEVISTDKNNQGLISLGGKIHPARIEAEVKPGDRFLAAVKQANGNEIVLSRENISGRINSLSNEQLIFLLNRGLGLDPKIFSLMNHFITGKDTALLSLLMSRNPYLDNLVKHLWSIIPRWGVINGKTSDVLANYFRKLGLEHENEIAGILKNNIDQRRLKEATAKEQILLLLKENANKLPSQIKDQLELFLDRISGQQMWIQSGVKDNAYLIMHIPLQQDSTVFNCRIAVESSRKGNKIDMDYCHIALEVETDNLGKIGADLRLFERRLQILLITDNAEIIQPMVEHNFVIIKERFADQNITLDYVSVKTYEDYPQFNGFITGQHVGGVDIKG